MIPRRFADGVMVDNLELTAPIAVINGGYGSVALCSP